MKHRLILLVIASLTLLCNEASCQSEQNKDFALIEKNKNNSAKDLFHDLNETKDTLLVGGDKYIRYVYSINTDYKRETQMLIDSTSGKVPLTHLSKGKHVFVVEQAPLKIVFVIRVLQDKNILNKNIELTKVRVSDTNDE